MFQDILPQYAVDLTKSDNMTMEFTLSMYQTNTVWFRVSYNQSSGSYRVLYMDSVRENGHAMLSTLHNAYLSSHGVPIVLRRIR